MLAKSRNFWSLTIACACFCWIVIRATVQSITIDEADTYLVFVAADWPAHWFAAANNHVLNTAFIRLFTAIFGVNHFIIRIPALIGALLYISSSLKLSWRLGKSAPVHLPLFLCLVLNPFVMDYLVAARGYSLAMGFLMFAILFGYEAISLNEKTHIPFQKVIWASLCLGLSFCSNFSFAIANMAFGFVLLFVLVLKWCQPFDRTSLFLFARIFGSIVAPGIVVAFVVCGYTIIHWPHHELVYGSGSWQETYQSVIDDCLYEVNPNIAHPMIFEWVVAFGKTIPNLLLGILFFCLLFSLRQSLRRSEPLSNHASLSVILIGSFLFTVFGHWMAWRTLQVKLPFHRTALFFAIFFFVTLISLVVNSRMEWRGIPYRIAMTTLWGVAIYFVFCLRLGHFKEWGYERDAEQIYWTLAHYNRQSALHEIQTTWRYSAPLRFTNQQANSECLAVKTFRGTPNASGRAYVLFFPEDQQFIQANRLAVVYHNEITGGTIALRRD